MKKTRAELLPARKAELPPKRKGKDRFLQVRDFRSFGKGGFRKRIRKILCREKRGNLRFKKSENGCLPEFRFRKSSSKALRRAFRRHGFSGALNPDCAGCVCVCGGEILYFRVLLHRPAAFRREPDGSRFRGIFVRHPVPLFRKFSVWLFLQ